MVSFHTRIVGSINGSGLPVPDLQLRDDPPSGMAQPEVAEDIGSTTTVNNDARVRVWVLHVAAEGDYGITTDGKVSAFINPQLGFGHSSSPARWIWVLYRFFWRARSVWSSRGYAGRGLRRNSGLPNKGRRPTR